MLTASIAVVTGSLAATTVPRPVQATSPGVVAGRLTCSVEAKAVGQKDAPRDLSCRLQRISGPPATYTGKIRRYGRGQVAGGELVLTWSVIAPRRNVRPESLAGRYRGAVRNRTIRRSARDGRGLVGGSGGMISLKPIATPGLGGTSIGIVELDLTLASARA